MPKGEAEIHGPDQRRGDRRLRSQALADGRRAARQHGRRRVQARRPRPDLPQVHLRRLRGAARASSKPSRRRAPTPRTRTSTAPSTSSGCRRRRAGRTCKASAKQPTIGTARRRRDGRHRARQPLAQGRAAQGLRPPGARQAAARPADRPRSATSRSATRRAAPRTCSAASTSTSSSQFASAEGKKGGEFYTPRCVVSCWSRCSSPTRAASTTPAAAPAACSCSREKFVEAHGGKLGDISIYGQESQLHHLAAGQDEPRHPRHRRPDRARRHLPQRPPPRPQGRLHPRQPAVQRQRLARRAAARRQALEVRRAAGRQRQLRLGPAHHPPPRAHRASPASCWPTARCRRTSPARARSARPSSRPTWWTAWSRCRASSSTRRRSRSACGSSRATRRTASFRDRRGEMLFIDARKLGRMVDRIHRELTDEDIAKHRRHLPRLARRQGRGRVRRRARLLQERDARRDPQARPRAHARPLRRRRGAGGRRRAVRGEDAAAHRDAARAAGRGREAGRRHRRQPEGAWVWRVRFLY